MQSLIADRRKHFGMKNPEFADDAIDFARRYRSFVTRHNPPILTVRRQQPRR
jgi:hypothetical protein